MYATPQVLAATGDAAWVRAMLTTEAALARAGAEVGLVPPGCAADIVAACRTDLVDVAQLAAAAGADATPVTALVRRLRELAGPRAARYVHLGATSQDILDCAQMLVARSAIEEVLVDAAEVARLLAGLAAVHRDAEQVGRTLLRQAAVTTFGAACAARLVAVDEARHRLADVSRRRLAVQLGGPVGVLGGLGPRALDLAAALARELGLAEPVTPWHTSRGRVVEVAAAAGVLAGELGAVSADLVLLASVEIGEVAPSHPGGSSAMPHKQNSARAVLAVACTHRVPGLVATLMAGMPQQLQRAAGAWQAEWGTQSSLLCLVAASAQHTRAALDGLHVDTARMADHVAELRSLARSGSLDAQTWLDPGTAGLLVDRALQAHANLATPGSPAEDPTDRTAAGLTGRTADDPAGGTR